jgi:hypothetical protein
MGAVTALICLSGLIRSSWTEITLLQIDDEGVTDRRLGVGKILWSDVGEVKLLTTEEHCFLCVKVENPENYLTRLRGPKLEKVLFHRNLGFQTFNIDLRMVDANLLDLKRQIDERVKRNRSLPK